MLEGAFGWRTGAKEYKQYLQKFAKTIPRANRNLEAMTIQDSSHTDETDKVLYMQYEMSWFNRSLRINGIKKQGTNIQFHEFLGLLWLDFLYRIKLHNNTFTPAHL